MKKYLPVLRNSSFFKGLTDEEILSILHCVEATAVSKERDSYIFRAADSTEVMGLVVSGCVLVIQEDLWGHRNILSKCHAGDFFGEPYAASPGAVLNISVVADDFLLNSMDVIEGTIDWEALKSGNYVLYALTADDNGNIIDDPNIHVGDTLHFNHVQMNGLSSSIDNNFDCKVMAKVLINENTDTIRSTGFAKFYMPTDVFLPLCEQPHLVSFPFNVVDGMEADMEEFLSSYVEDIEPSMNYDSKQTYINSFNDLTSLIITIGGALSIIIGLIGITNFVNSVLTSIITRRKELAMLQSIGMTGKQLKKMLSFEGLYYATGTVVASIVFGSLVSVIIVRAISNSIWFFTYKFVIFPMFVIYPFLIALTVIIPAIIYRKIAKTSIIERLHQN